MQGENTHIPIRNVYYMLSYAFQTFNHTSFEEKFGKEHFNNIYDFFAELLYLGISSQLKRGIHKEYVTYAEPLKTLKGKLVIQQTIDHKIKHEQLLHCEHDEWSEDCIYNQIVKTTALLLIKRPDLETQKKQNLKNILPFFSNVKTISLRNICWNTIFYNKNCGLYAMLIFICSLLLEKSILSTNGEQKETRFWMDGHKMSFLYEKFLLGYFKKHYHYLSPKSEEVPWSIDKSKSDNGIIPRMQTDIVLHGKIRTLIIDAKYYGKALTNHFGKKSIHTHNLYQIESYIFNKDIDHSGKIDGMLLYAQPDNENQKLDHKMVFNQGNVIYFKTLDLNQKFEEIESDLHSIASLLV